jgi:uncharacterized membrane protein YfcA
MDLSIYLPVAQTSVSLWLLLGVGLLVGTLSGFFGIAAALLMTPLYMAIGVPPAVAAASCANRVVASSASGALAHVRAGDLDLKMCVYLLIGGTVGGTVGAHVVAGLRVAGHADLVITVIYVLLLASLGALMLRDGIREHRGRLPHGNDPSAASGRRPLAVRIVAAMPFKTRFPGSDVRHSILVPLVAGMAVGILTAFLGIGGGFLLVPLVVGYLGVPLHLAAGTVLLQICLSCANVTVQHALVNGTVDVVLAFLAFVTSIVGSRLGVRLGRRLEADQLRILLAVIVLFVTVKLALDLVLPPEVTVVVAGAGR